MKLIRFREMPSRMSPHNALTFGRIVTSLLEHGGRVEHYELSYVAEDHQHGDKRCSGGASFVNYCLRRGWLEVVQ